MSRDRRTDESQRLPQEPVLARHLMEVLVSMRDLIDMLHEQMQTQMSDIQQQLGTLQGQVADMQRQLDALPTSGQTSRPSAALPDLAPPPPQADSVVPPVSGGYGPLILIGGDDDQVPDIVANGIDGARGEPLLTMDSKAASDMARATSEPDDLRDLHELKKDQTYYQDAPVIFGVDDNDLAQTRWAVIVNATDDATLIQALWPLIRHRAEQQGCRLPSLDVRSGENCHSWLLRQVPDPDTPWEQRPPILVYRPGETATGWLARHGVAHGPVDPARGVPYYLLIAARPGPITPDDQAHIPYGFQYELDMFWGVGRLCFNDEQGHHIYANYTAYAEQVVAFETQPAPPYYRNHVAFFGTRHDMDLSTERSADELLRPLIDGHSGRAGIAERNGFRHSVYLAKDASRANLERLLQGRDAHGQPALLFTATHGIGLAADDPRLMMQQGALLCQDWTGFGTIKREHWFSGEDLPLQTQVRGSVAILFACYGVGCPRADEFVFTLPGDKQTRTRPIIAPFPLVAQFPQRLLINGALAVLGHVERAWTHSFSGLQVPSQTQGFEDVINRMLAGKRMGFATDQFNMRQGVLSSLLTGQIEEIGIYNTEVNTKALAALWMARNDARNYALLGDPAVQVPVEKLAAAASAPGIA